MIGDLYPVAAPSLGTTPEEKLALLRAADAAARAYDARIVKVEASFVEQIKEVLVVTSDGRWARDVQPLLRFGVRAVAEDGAKRQAGSSGGGGRYGMDYFAQARKDAASHGAEAARIAIAMLDAREAPAGEMPVVLAAGDSGILLHEAVGHGLEADFNRKETSNYSGQIGKQVASTLCTVVDDGTVPSSRGSINVDDEGFASKENVLIENGMLVGYMHDRLSAHALRGRAVGQRPARVVPRDAAAAHDQHLAPARRRTTPRRSSARSSAASTPSGSAAARSTSPTATSCSR